MVVLLAAGGIAYVVLSDSATPVDVEEAVERYRDDGDATSSTTTAPARQLPAEGVYVYATEGDERIDILGGSTHGYPVETTVTIRHTACGLTQRWAPLDERWDEEEVCTTDAGRERRSLRTHHEFFGISDDADFTCEAGYLLFPAEPEVGDTWTTSCDSGDTLLTGTAEVVELEARTVGGQRVDTVHLRVTEQATGGDDGPSSDDYWLRTGDGLLVERSSTVETRSDSPVGTATYTERFTLRLTSLEPRT
ncbi:MAG TPA: hypothetical protein VFU14_10910 [Acidimicrobiales bacterium]|nr:hypothetical protein [Acidimicrobiales bacterium]